MISVLPDGVYQDDIKIADTLADAAWNQGILEMRGLYQKSTDTFTCQRCGLSYQVRRPMRFYPGSLLVDLQPTTDPGCPKGCAK